MAQRVKWLPAMLETWVQSLGQEDLLEKEMATHSSVLAWRIPGTGEPGRLLSYGVAQSQTRLKRLSSSSNMFYRSSNSTSNNLLMSHFNVEVCIKGVAIWKYLFLNPILAILHFRVYLKLHSVKGFFSLSRALGLGLTWFSSESESQSCLTLCDPMDYAVHGILQARLLEWVAFPFSKGSSQPQDWTQVSSIAGGFFTSSWDQSPNAGVLGSIPRSHMLQLKIPHATVKMKETRCPTKDPVHANK